MYLNFNLTCSMLEVKEQSREICCHRKGRRVVLMRDGLVDPNDKVEDSFKVFSTHNLPIECSEIMDPSSASNLVNPRKSLFSITLVHSDFNIR